MSDTVLTAEDVTVYLLPGDHLDAGNVRDFKSAVAPLVNAKHRVAFDMSGLKFVDSSGLGALLSCLRQLNAAGGDLKLCGMTRPVRALFELVRMHRIFEIYNTPEEAVRAYQGRA